MSRSFLAVLHLVGAFFFSLSDGLQPNCNGLDLLLGFWFLSGAFSTDLPMALPLGLRGGSGQLGAPKIESRSGVRRGRAQAGAESRLGGRRKKNCYRIGDS